MPTNLLFGVRPRIRPPASPTKLARATISRTVVVLKMTKTTKGDKLGMAEVLVECVVIIVIDSFLLLHKLVPNRFSCIGVFYLIVYFVLFTFIFLMSSRYLLR